MPCPPLGIVNTNSTVVREAYKVCQQTFEHPFINILSQIHGFV